MSDDSQRNEAPADPFKAMEEGTEELDQAALLRRLQADSQSTKPVSSTSPGGLSEHTAETRERAKFEMGRPPSDMRDTVQHPAVAQHTAPMESKPPDPTQHYTVPESLMAQAQLGSRRIPTEVRNLPTIPIEAIVLDGEGEGTSTFSTADIIEFEAVVDPDGYVALPQSALAGRYAPGARVKVIIVPND